MEWIKIKYFAVKCKQLSSALNCFRTSEITYKQALLCSIELGSIKCNLETAKIRIKRGNYCRETVKIGIRTPLKSYIYFRFVTKQQLTSRRHFAAARKIL